MIRLFDWVAAFIFSNFILVSLIIGLNSTSMVGAIFFGMVAGIIFRIWDDVYCQIRVRMESRR